MPFCVRYSCLQQDFFTFPYLIFVYNNLVVIYCCSYLYCIIVINPYIPQQQLQVLNTLSLIIANQPDFSTSIINSILYFLYISLQIKLSEQIVITYNVCFLSSLITVILNMSLKLDGLLLLDIFYLFSILSRSTVIFNLFYSEARG